MPTANALILRETSIRPIDYCRQIRVRLFENQYCQRLITVRALRVDYATCIDLWLSIQRLFQVFGVDVQSGPSDDDIFSAALEM